MSKAVGTLYGSVKIAPPIIVTQCKSLACLTLAPTVETKLMFGRSDHESMKSVGELRGRQF